MSALAPARATTQRVGFPWIRDKHGRPMPDGTGAPLTVRVPDLLQEVNRAISNVEKARLYLRDARMRACGDLSMVEPIRIALMALDEALGASVARRSALEGL